MAQDPGALSIETNLHTTPACSSWHYSDIQLLLCTITVSQATLDKYPVLNTSAHKAFVAREVSKKLMEAIAQHTASALLEPKATATFAAVQMLCLADLGDVLWPTEITHNTVCFSIPSHHAYTRFPGNRLEDFTTSVLVELYTGNGMPRNDAGPDGTEHYQRLIYDHVVANENDFKRTRPSWHWIRMDAEWPLSKNPQPIVATSTSSETIGGSGGGDDTQLMSVTCDVKIEQTTPHELLEKATHAASEAERSRARNAFETIAMEQMERATDDCFRTGNCIYSINQSESVSGGLELHRGDEYSFKLIGTGPSGIAVTSKPCHRLFYPNHVSLVGLVKVYRAENSTGPKTKDRVRDFISGLEVRSNRFKGVRTVCDFSDEKRLRDIDPEDFAVSLKSTKGKIDPFLASNCVLSGFHPFKYKHDPLLADSIRKLPRTVSVPQWSELEHVPRAVPELHTTISKAQHTDRIDIAQDAYFRDRLRLIFVEPKDIVMDEYREWEMLKQHLQESWQISSLGTVDHKPMKLTFTGRPEDEGRWREQLQNRADMGSTKKPIFVFVGQQSSGSSMYKLVKKLCDLDLGLQTHYVPLPLNKNSRGNSGSLVDSEVPIRRYSSSLVRKMLNRQPPVIGIPSNKSVATGIHIHLVDNLKHDRPNVRLYLIAVVSRDVRTSSGYRTSVSLQRATSFRSLNIEEVLRKHIPTGVRRLLVYRSGHFFSDKGTKKALAKQRNNNNSVNSKNDGGSSKAVTAAAEPQAQPLFRASAAGYELQLLKAKLALVIPRLHIDYMLVETDTIEVCRPETKNYEDGWGVDYTFSSASSSSSSSSAPADRDADESVVVDDGRHDNVEQVVDENRTCFISEAYFNSGRPTTISVHRGLDTSGGSGGSSSGDTTPQPITRLTICEEPRGRFIRNSSPTTSIKDACTQEEEGEGEEGGEGGGEAEAERQARFNAYQRSHSRFWSPQTLKNVAETFHDDYLGLHNTKLPMPSHLAQLALKRACLHLKVYGSCSDEDEDEDEDEGDGRGVGGRGRKQKEYYLPSVHEDLRGTLYYV